MANEGNEWWKLRSRHGRKPIYDSPEMLAESCQEYFQYVLDNPLTEEKLFMFQGEVSREVVELPRLMCNAGLTLFLGISYDTWLTFRDKDGFSEVYRMTVDTMNQQKLTHASVGHFNANIISRLMGLKDSSEVDHSSKDGTMSPGAAPLTKEEAQELLDKNK